MPSTRSSVDRSVRDTSEVMMMLRMKTDAILIPSGRSIMFATLVYTNTSVIDANSGHRLFWRHAAIATAMAPDVISTRTPVAYAPA